MADRSVAVVLGASATGLATAGVLARTYARVIVVERDELGARSAAPRKGVAQGRHNHNVTPRATQVLESIFPGLCEDLRARGATVCDAGGAGRWIVAGNRLPRVELGAAQILAARPLLDAALLDHLLALGNVELRDGRDVCGLLLDDQRARGARLLCRATGAEERLEGDLVVDATGRGSRTPRWLGELGFDVPVEEQLEVSVAYTTRVFRRRPGDLGGDRYVYCSAVPPADPRGGVAFAVDDDRWMVLLFEYGARPPSELEGFQRFAARLPAPELAEIATSCEPLEDAATYSFPRSTRRRYDLCRRLPSHLLVIGDALQSTNPSWGLGITSAALQLEALRVLLARRGPPSERFFGDAIRACESVWGPVLLRDQHFDCVPGDAPAPLRAVRSFFGSALRAARHDRDLARIVLGVIAHVREPTALFRPDRLARIAASAWRSRAAPSASAMLRA